MDILLTVSILSLSAIILALAFLFFSPGFHSKAIEKDIFSIIFFCGLATTFAVSASLTFPDIGNVFAAAMIAITLSAFFILIITGRLEANNRSIARPTNIRVIDKFFPEIHHKLFAYLISVIAPTATVILLLPETASELTNLLFTAGAIFLGNMAYSIMFWVKVDNN